MRSTSSRDGTVDVLLFSMLREQIGTSALTIQMDAPMTTESLLERLSQDHPPIRASLSCVRVAVNEAYVPSSHVVHPGDEVALITPVSGG